MKRPFWSHEEDAALRKAHRSALGIGRIQAEIMPYRSVKSIRYRQFELGLKRLDERADLKPRLSDEDDGVAHWAAAAQAGEALLLALGKYHAFGAGELAIPSDGGRFVAAPTCHPSLLTSPAQLCAEIV